MLRALNGALGLLTIVPTPPYYPAKNGESFAFFPLVGALIGAALWATHALLGQGFVAEVRAAGVLLVWVLLTGGLHLDGFADTCDGVFATVAPARRLEIMKDPRTGAWAVVGLILLLLLKWSLLLDVRALPALLVAPMAGRWLMTCVAWMFPYARASGMGSHFREGLGAQQVIGASLTLVPLSVWGWQVALALVIVAGVGVLFARWASGRLGGGLTGDVYGALCEMGELCVLGVFAWGMG